MYQFEFDIHTHSIASGHGSGNTITQMVQQAKEQGLKLLGISEHGPATPGSCTPSYFQGIGLAPRIRMGIPVIFGAELNILDGRGRLDLEDSIARNLDYCIASMHTATMPKCSLSENTDAYIETMKKPHVKIIGHCDDVHFPVDYRRLVKAAVHYGVLIELNNASLAPGGYRGDTRDNLAAIMRLCVEFRHPVLFSSDSHGIDDIGNFHYISCFAKEVRFPEELILNPFVQGLDSYLNKPANVRMGATLASVIFT